MTDQTAADLAQRWATDPRRAGIERTCHPGRTLAHNCSPSFNGRRHLDDDQIAKFQRELAATGYAFRLITLAGFHALDHSMFTLAQGHADHDLTAYVDPAGETTSLRGPTETERFS